MVDRTPNNNTNPLFTSSVSSPFDCIGLPTPTRPLEEAPSKEAQNNSKTSTKDSAGDVSSYSAAVPVITAAGAITTAPPSKASLPLPMPPKNVGGSLRRPVNKYVVPTEVDVVTSPVGYAPNFYSPVSPSVPCIDSLYSPMDSSTLGIGSSHHDPGSVADIPFGTTPTTFMSPTSDISSSSATDATIIPQSLQNLADVGSIVPTSSELYHPVMPHWFYKSNDKTWRPFSFIDSMNLEEAHRTNNDSLVATDGGRFDVSVKDRWRRPVYWTGEDSKVRRCSWFNRSALNTTPEPYEESISDRLEEEYKDAMQTGRWHRQVELQDGGRVMINSPMSMLHYPSEPFPAEGQAPLTVKRGADEFEISDGESDQIDHLLFVVHGIGSVCDLSFRPVEECVDDFREIGEQLVSTHFKQAFDSGLIGRLEILPISWHNALHGEATGLDQKLKPITLRSIPKLREFTNDTVLDVLFYTSPVYCQLIIDTVASELTRTLKLFQERHPEFTGGVSLGGHSLGSVILFDLLMHQSAINPEKSTTASEEESCGIDEVSTEEPFSRRDNSGTSSIDFEIGVAGTGQPSIKYPQLGFKPEAFFLFGSPVAMFVLVRGLNTLGLDFKLPSCDKVYNIFHPFDPVAYRLETLINPSLTNLRPVLVPHHKGRKRLHLELKDTLERVGSDIKHKIVDSLQSTWAKITQIYSGTSTPSLEYKVDEALEEQMTNLSMGEAPETPNFDTGSANVGLLNGGRRIDYVLQEKPYESFTEYLFALQAHLTYWRSEDTMLLILNELYSSNGILPDSKLNQDKDASSPAPSTSSYTHTFTSPTGSAQPITEPPSHSDQPVTFFNPSDIKNSPTPVSMLPSSPIAPISTPGTAPRIGSYPVVDPLTLPPAPPGDPTQVSTQKVIGPPPMTPLGQNMRRPNYRKGGP